MTHRLRPVGRVSASALVAALVALMSLTVAACSGGKSGVDRASAPTTAAGAGAGAGNTSTSADAGGAAAGTAAPATTATTIPKVNPPVTGPARVTSDPGRPAAASCPSVPERVAPRPDRPSYKLKVDVRPDDGTVVGEQTVKFTPDRDTDRVVLRLWANAPRIAKGGGHIDVQLEGAQQPSPTMLVLPRALKAGQSVELSMTWQLTLPSSSTSDRISRTGDAIRLGSFFPVLSWHPGIGWATEPPTSGFAESSLSLPSDFDVTLTAPDRLKVLATGVNDAPNHWLASGVPDWAVSVGDFRLVSGTIDGIAVTVGVDRQVGDGAQPYYDKVAAALHDFNGRFGAYPWPSYSLALTPDLSGGVEYPMHVMQGPGTLGRTTSHEVGHQWFYGLVATNQGATPWIDEGMASWAEARFEDSLQSMKERTIPAEGRGHAGEPMTFWESRQSAYYRSVYVQGTQALAALGPPELVDCALRQLVARQAYRVTGNGEVVAALTTVFPDAATVLARYGIRP